ncbi:hypothetical protein FN846DRAFT_935065 [Sphaerosporella brunnea]|uniref:Uncharacterized protein n=1 Tax=Sphaerosporella brunnea TaxID=1250544 RepID=A0A5J5F647_9PEZI|nr:hypothetical protein FN846DRAFT_935065 [Sphaerosporella brunnea]
MAPTECFTFLRTPRPDAETISSISGFAILLTFHIVAGLSLSAVVEAIMFLVSPCETPLSSLVSIFLSSGLLIPLWIVLYPTARYTMGKQLEAVLTDCTRLSRIYYCRCVLVLWSFVRNLNVSAAQDVGGVDSSELSSLKAAVIPVHIFFFAVGSHLSQDKIRARFKLLLTPSELENAYDWCRAYREAVSFRCMIEHAIQSIAIPAIYLTAFGERLEGEPLVHDSTLIKIAMHAVVVGIVTSCYPLPGLPKDTVVAPQHPDPAAAAGMLLAQCSWYLGSYMFTATMTVGIMLLNGRWELGVPSTASFLICTFPAVLTIWVIPDRAGQTLQQKLHSYRNGLLYLQWCCWSLWLLVVVILAETRGPIDSTWLKNGLFGLWIANLAPPETWTRIAKMSTKVWSCVSDFSRLWKGPSA